MPFKAAKSQHLNAMHVSVLRQLLAKYVTELASDVFEPRQGIITSYLPNDDVYVILWDTDEKVGKVGDIRHFVYEPVSRVSPATLLHSQRYTVT